MAKKKAAKKKVKQKSKEKITVTKKSIPKSNRNVPASKLITTPKQESFWLMGEFMGKMARSWAITDEAAIALAESVKKSKGGNSKHIWLVSLRTLSDTAAAAFATSNAEYLCLDSVEALSDAAVESLSQFKGEHLSLGMLELPDHQAEILSKYAAGNSHQSLALNGLSSISAGAMSHLTKLAPQKKVGVTLALNGVTALSDEASEALIKFGSRLNKSGYPEIELNALETISPHLAQSIGKMERGCGLQMASVRELTVEFADVLAAMTKKKWGDQIRLEGLDTVSREAATSLAKTKLDQLYLNVSRLSEEVIQILAKRSNLNLTTDSGWYGDKD